MIFQQGREFPLGQRPAEQIALHGVAAVLNQEALLILGFHPFGNHLQAQAATERDNGADDGRAAGAAADVNYRRIAIIV